MPTDLPLLGLIAVVATAVAVAVLRRTSEQEAGGGRPASHAHRPGIFAAVSDLVDASIGVYLARRMLGRPTTTRADSRAERARVVLAAAEEERRRATVAGPSIVAPTRLVVAGTAASHSPRELRDRQAHPVAGAPQVPAWQRRSAMPRQGAFAAVGLFAVLAAGVALWPRADGAVLSVTGTAAPSAITEPLTSASPPPTTEAPTSAPTAEPTEATSPTPSPAATPTTDASPTPTATPAATATPRPTARPTNTPRPTAHPTPAPTPTVGPTPSTTPTPTPEATPTPTPAAEPTPTPTPAPTPTPDPPTPTPDPPTPTPDPPTPTPDPPTPTPDPPTPAP